MLIHHQNERRIGLRLSVLIGWFLLTSIGQPSIAGAAGPPAEGGSLPAIRLEMPDDPDRRAYLGLKGADSFAIPEIDADIVIVEIFSMY